MSAAHAILLCLHILQLGLGPGISSPTLCYPGLSICIFESSCRTVSNLIASFVILIILIYKPISTILLLSHPRFSILLQSPTVSFLHHPSLRHGEDHQQPHEEPLEATARIYQVRQPR